MIKRTLFLFFFYFGVIFVCIFFLPALILPQKITLYGGRILGFWSKFCLELFLSTKIVIKGKEKVLNNKKFFIASAHQSQFETFFLQSLFKIFSFPLTTTFVDKNISKQNLDHKPRILPPINVIF